jgi:tetratricopeptide (TPR) repeat protein
MPRSSPNSRPAKAVGAPAPGAPTLPLHKRLLFGSIVALLSVGLFFGILEGGLRLVGYGHDTRFFHVERDGDGKRWIRENPDFTLAYFSPELVRRPHPFRVPAKKPPGTYRIIVLGESAARGDPAASFSISRTLEVMLRGAYPDRPFEVINAGITAINSHVMRAVAADCEQLEPDLYIVYAGHNEVIGPFGPGTVFLPFLRSPLAIDVVVRLRRTRTGQLIGAIGRALGRDRVDLEQWRGMTMFLQHEIAVNDPRLADVEALFRRNLSAVAKSARSAGAGAIFCTVLTNQRDFAPFRSRHRDGLTEAETRRWEEAFAAGNRAAGEGDQAAAETHWQRAWEIDDTFAEVAFRLGRLYLALRRDEEARSFLQRALDSDTLRFRTDSRLQRAIREAATADRGHVELVDVAGEIGAGSPHGLIGDEALYEHVHLTAHATWRTARLLLPRIGVDLVRRGLAEAVAPEPFSYEEVRQRLGFTVFEQAMIIDEMLDRFSHPPFTAQSDHAVRMAMWRERAAAANRLLESPENRRQIEAQYERALAHWPDDWILARNYGWMLAAFNENARAIPWLERAYAAMNQDVDTLVALGRALAAEGREAEANDIFEALRGLAPTHPELPENRKPRSGSS